MANAEHLKVFEQGVTAWNRWRQKHRGVTPDLSGADLKRANFRYANLNDANLEEADMEGANLGRAYLEGAELRGARQRGAHLFSADLRHAVMRRTDLREAQMWYAHLERADLRGATFTGADLRCCDLTGADLRSADLGGASLACANLWRTDLRDALLTGTNLHGARFTECRLAGADFDRAEAALTAFNAVDFSRARGLDTVRHERPSSIGTDSLELTAAGLDGDGGRDRLLHFLRGAGVPEVYLERFAAAAEAPPAPAYVVHSLADRGFARRLYAALQDRGVRCWLHEQPMLPGENLDEGFDLGPRDGGRLVLCCSPAALSSWWLTAELEQIAGRTDSVLQPIDLGGAGSAWDEARGSRELPGVVADFAGWEGDDGAFERGLERLVAALGG